MSQNWYYAKEGQPQGPLDHDTISRLYREGQIAPDTLVWQEGMADWVMASTLLGASGSLSPGLPVPAPSGSGEIDFSACFSEGWAVFKAHWPVMVAAGAVFFFLSMAIQGPFQVVQIVLQKQLEQQPVLFIGLMGLTYLVSLVFTPPLTAGLFQFCLVSLRDKPRLEVLFEGFKTCWLQSCLCVVVMTLIIILGFLCLIIPGIYLAVAYYYAIPLVIDRRMGFWEAMELSRKTVHKQWFMVFAVSVVGGLLSITGMVLCCVGIVGTLPLGYLVIMQAYRQLFAAAPPS
ncbi:MAG: GYF domain-containing protein [Candidatus Methylacidiphilales bacterium]|nr:GYF domain-containing protein [Candidatus Methylacidiphilales bacterium]